MTDNRLENMMEDALNGELSEHEQLELQQRLETNPEEAKTFDKQLRVDSILSRPPHERAPTRLALTIMARIAETAKAEQRAHKPMTELDEAMLNVAIQMVTVATMPLLIGASYLILNSASDPELMDAVLEQVALLLILVIDVMKVLLEEAQMLFEEDPQSAMALLTLIPITLLELVKQVLGYDDDNDEKVTEPE